MFSIQPIRYFLHHILLGNAKPPAILSQMIIEAREIRENQLFRSNLLPCVVTSSKPKDQNSKVIN